MCGSPAPSCFFFLIEYLNSRQSSWETRRRKRETAIYCAVLVDCTSVHHSHLIFPSLRLLLPSFLPQTLQFCSEKRIDDKRRSFTTTWGSFIISYHFQKDDTDVGKKKKTITKCKTDLKSLQKKREKSFLHSSTFFIIFLHTHTRTKFFFFFLITFFVMTMAAAAAAAAFT